MRTIFAYIEWDPESKLYVGLVPGIPGAHTQAASLDELRKNLAEVLELCLEQYRGSIDDLPNFVGVQQSMSRFEPASNGGIQAGRRFFSAWVFSRYGKKKVMSFTAMRTGELQPSRTILDETSPDHCCVKSFVRLNCRPRNFNRFCHARRVGSQSSTVAVKRVVITTVDEIASRGCRPLAPNCVNWRNNRPYHLNPA